MTRVAGVHAVADESKNMDGVAALLRDRCGLGTTSLEDRLTLKRVAVMVGLRAARLSAMAIAAVASQIDAVDRDAPKCHVGIDGSVYLKFTHFRAVSDQPSPPVSLLGPLSHPRACYAVDGRGAVRAGLQRQAVRQPRWQRPGCWPHRAGRSARRRRRSRSRRRGCWVGVGITGTTY